MQTWKFDFTGEDVGTGTGTATPAGSTSSGAVFTGRLTGDHASGTWRNEDAGLSGSWTARRGGKPADFSPKVHCRIDAEEFDATPPIVADAMIPLQGDKWLFRIIAGHGVGTGPGSHAMSLEPTWRSSAIVKGREFKIDRGIIRWTTYEPRVSDLAVGTLDFDAGGHHGVCSFDVLVTVQDLPRLMRTSQR